MLIADFACFREYLLPPETQPLHEAVYFSAAHILREHLSAAPRIALHTALNNPYYYLKVRSRFFSDSWVQIPGIIYHKNIVKFVVLMSRELAAQGCTSFKYF